MRRMHIASHVLCIGIGLLSQSGCEYNYYVPALDLQAPADLSMDMPMDMRTEEDMRTCSNTTQLLRPSTASRMSTFRETKCTLEVDCATPGTPCLKLSSESTMDTRALCVESVDYPIQYNDKMNRIGVSFKYGFVDFKDTSRTEIRLAFLGANSDIIKEEAINVAPSLLPQEHNSIVLTQAIKSIRVTLAATAIQDTSTRIDFDALTISYECAP